jgi:hypothetical protein
MNDTVDERGMEILRSRYGARMSLDEAVTELERQEGRKVDIISPPHHLEVIPTHSAIETSRHHYDGNIGYWDYSENSDYDDGYNQHSTDGGLLAMNVTDQGISNIGINNHSLSQISTAIKMPFRSLKHLLALDPELAAVIIDRGIRRLDDSHLLRFLDEQNRAFLSNRYMIFDNNKLFQFVLSAMQQGQWQCKEFSFTETRGYAHFVIPTLSSDVRVGDTVSMGIKISNSEVGCGSINIQFELHRLICLNLMAVPTRGVRQIHLGESKSDGVLSAKTMSLRQASTFSEIKDVIDAASKKETFENLLIAAGESASVSLPNPQGSIRVLSDSIGMSESEEMQVLTEMVKGEDNSLWGALNAVTATAREMEDYDRKSQLESSAGNILMDQSAWKKIVAAPASTVKRRKKTRRH